MDKRVKQSTTLIEMNDFSVTLERKRIKNLNLRIKRSGEVQISAPFQMPMDAIHSFLGQKRAWIEMHRTRLLALEQRTPQALIAEGWVNFQGLPYQLHLHDSSRNQRVEFYDNQVHLFLRPQASSSHKELLLRAWYRCQMENSVKPLLDKWQSIMGLRVHQVSIKHMRSRWGSCHPGKKHITLNLRLIEKPLICLEYVIVHELVHLFEASHNKRFYALMSQYLPDWRHIKKQLS